MTINEARLIREIKKWCTYRYLAEVYYPDTDWEHGVQCAGEDLCKEALAILYPGRNIWALGALKSIKFSKANKVDDHFWWE